MDGRSERRIIRELGGAVQAAMAQVGLKSAANMNRFPKPDVRTTNTQGHCAIVGRIPGQRCTLEVWQDMFVTSRKPRVWYGCRSGIKECIDMVAKSCRTTIGRPNRLLDSDVFSSTNGTLRVRDPFGAASFGRPWIEYHTSEFYYGIHENVRADNKSRWLIDRIVKFYETILIEVGRCSNSGIADRDVYPGHENRKRVRSHLVRERRPHLATHCKQRDNHECQVCGFHFETMYGPLGRDFAEAHHLVPLATLNRQIETRVEDLVTVCANCHRMLHRLNGERQDVHHLRQVIKQSKSSAQRGRKRSKNAAHN